MNEKKNKAILVLFNFTHQLTLFFLCLIQDLEICLMGVTLMFKWLV